MSVSIPTATDEPQRGMSQQNAPSFHRWNRPTRSLLLRPGWLSLVSPSCMGCSSLSTRAPFPAILWTESSTKDLNLRRSAEVWSSNLIYILIRISKVFGNSLVANSRLIPLFWLFKKAPRSAFSSQPVSLAKVHKSMEKLATLLRPCLSVNMRWAAVSGLEPLSKTSKFRQEITVTDFRVSV